MFTKFSTRSQPASVNFSTKQGSLVQSPSPTTAANVSEKSFSTLSAKIESGVKNFKRFTLLFKQSDPAASASTRTYKKGVSTSNISRPEAGSKRAFRKIDEPSPSELNDKIENFWTGRRQNLDSGTVVDWAASLSKSPEGSELHATISKLQGRLTQIDENVAQSINELRLTAYDDLRKAKARRTAKDELHAKNSTKRNYKERLSVGRICATMKGERLAKRTTQVKEEEALDVVHAFGRFKQRVMDEFEPGRLKDMRDACVELLQEYFDGQFPTGTLYELVREISPDAVERYMRDYSTFAKGSPLLASWAAAINSDDARELLGRPTK